MNVFLSAKAWIQGKEGWPHADPSVGIVHCDFHQIWLLGREVETDVFTSVCTNVVNMFCGEGEVFVRNVIVQLYGKYRAATLFTVGQCILNPN